MAFSGRDRSKTAGTEEEFIPLTSDQDGSHLESSTSLGSLVIGASASTTPGAEEGPSISMALRNVSTEPVLSRDLSSSDDSSVTTFSLVHDEVNKMFDADWRFEVESLTMDPNSKAQAANLMGRECSKLALSEFYQMDEAEISRHRRVSYPHIHQPLRSLSSKSLSKSGRAHKAKKKARKKKKKEKIRSFPSQSAIKSPTIVEEDEEYYMEYYDDSASSECGSGSDLYLDEEYDVISGEHPALESNGGLIISRSAIPVMTVMPPTPEKTPSPEVDRSPPPLSPELVQLVEALIDSALPEEKSQGYDESKYEAVSSGVDFYIGTDATSMLLEPSSPPAHVSSQSLSQEYSSAQLLAVSDEEEAYLSDSGVPLVQDEIEMSRHSVLRNASPDKTPSPILPAALVEEAILSNRPVHLSYDSSDDRGTPSPGATASPSRRPSLRGKVTFVLGGDSAYPSYNNSQVELSDAVHDEEHGGEGEGHNSDKESEWKKKNGKDSGRLKEEIEADVLDASPRLLRVPSADGSQSTRASKRRHHHHHEHFRTEDLIMRRQKGSEVKLDETFRRSPTETEEASLLYKADLDEMASHRFEDQRGIRRHKIARKKGSLHSVVHMSKTHHEKKPKMTKKFDHSPHEVFVELDELHFGGEDMMEWREKARWIKFEEDVEEGAERWGKPHVASLSFHSLLELRRGLEKGTLLLDLEATDLTSIVHNVVENMVIRDLVEEEVRGKLLRTLLLKHKHVNGRSAFLRRTPSYSNLASLDASGKRHQQHDKGLLNSISQSSFGSTIGLNKSPSQSSVSDKKNKDSKGAAKLEMVKVDVDNNMTDKQTGGIHIGISPVEQKKHVQDIMKRIPKGAEASTVLVGQVDFLKTPAMAFVRLAEGKILENLTEVPLPVRFLFILLGPENGGMDYHEVGRSLSTLMSNQQFHEVAYRAESRDELLRAINNFLDDSIVLPPGDWDHRTLLPITHMARKRALLRKQKKQLFEEEEALLEKVEKDEIPTDPLKRTGCLFGGVVNDVRRRYPHYLSDIRDAVNLQCLKTLFFIFFTCLSPCIAFGGLLSEKTDSYMGVSETMVATSVFGMMFSMFSGQPLLIIGATGPVLVFEESLYKFCLSNKLEFLPVRFWIGLWVCAITSAAVALEGSFLVRYITRFTEEIFAILISLIFIYEVVKKLMQIFSDHPLMEDYCFVTGNHTYNDSTSFSYSHWPAHYEMNNSDWQAPVYNEEDEVLNKPNTALLSLILVFGTFLIAYFLRVFRNSKFLGRSVRRALGDFGVLISLLAMVLLSIIMNKTYVQKLDITDSLTPTSRKRGWFINPMGIDKPIPLWLAFAAALPGFLIFILLFMETQITEMILNKKERKLKKGSGYHLDQLLLGFLTLLGGLFGLPWMCAATVRTVAHVSALSEYSRTHAPGEKPQLLGVKEQRVTNFAVHLLIGLSIGMGPVLRAIPIPALFGIFLYLGVSTLSGVQMCERIKLLLMPVKYHPSVSYVRKVRTMQMHKFTLIQLTCLLFLIVIKSTDAALAFPFLLILLVPFRLKVMPKCFDSADLAQLDKEEEEFELDDEDDPDFYQQAHMPV